MEDAERLRRMYLVAIAQHEIDVFQLNIAEHVHARRRWRRGQRKRQFWTRAWIQRRSQFGLYDQLMVELRREDPYSFKNFMRMPPEMFDQEEELQEEVVLFLWRPASSLCRDLCQSCSSNFYDTNQ